MSRDEIPPTRAIRTVAWMGLILLDGLLILVFGAGSIGTAGALWWAAPVAILAVAGASSGLLYRSTGSGPEAASAALPVLVAVVGSVEMRTAQELEWLAGLVTMVVAAFLVHLVAIWALYRARSLPAREA